jgi:O-antigen ligase/tetratricopeptide (TPR) repeat protein
MPSSTRPNSFGRAILFAQLLLSPIVFSKDTVEVFEYDKVAVLLLAAIALAAYFLPSARRFRVPRDAVSLGFLLFLGSAAASTIFSISPWTSIFGAHESFAGIFTIAAYTILFFATRSLCRTADDARRLLVASVIGAAVASTYALVQVTQIDPIRWGRISRFGEYIRPFATMGHPNFLSAFLVMAFPIAAFFVYRAVRRDRAFEAATFGAVGLLSSVVIAISISRGAWLAFAAVLGILLFAAFALGRERSARTYVFAALAPFVAGALTIGVLYLAIPSGPSIVQSVSDRAAHLTEAATRKEIWKAGLRMFAEKPVFGCGLDAFQLAFEQKRTVEYWITEWNGTPTKAHNEAIHILATQGALGGLAVLAITLGLLAAGRRAWRRAAPENRPLLVAIFAGIAGFYVQDVFSFTVAGCGTLFVTFAAILSRLGARAEDEDPRPAPPPDSQAWFVAMLVAADILAAAAFFYNVGDSGAADHGAGSARAFAGLAILTAFGAVSLAALLLEERPDAEAAPPPGDRRRGGAPRVDLLASPAPTPAGVALRAGLWIGALVLMHYGVERPYRANVECREGSQLLPQLTSMGPHYAREYAARAVAHEERAVLLDRTKELYWVKLGTAAQIAAKLAPDVAERRRRLLLSKRAFEESIALIPANSYNHANLGRLLGDLAKEGLARPQDAYDAFDDALSTDANNAYFYVDAADTALALGDRGNARRYAQKGSELYAPRPGYPGFGPPRGQLGYLALVEGHYAEAATLLAEAAGGDWEGDESRRLVVLVNLSSANFQIGHMAEAERAARQALAIAPTYAEAEIALAKALDGAGRRAEAIEEYRRVLERHPDNERAKEALKALGVALPAPAPATPELPAEER